MSKLGNTLKEKGVEPVLDYRGKRLQCPKCRSKALELKHRTVHCYNCGHTFAKPKPPKDWDPDMMFY